MCRTLIPLGESESTSGTGCRQVSRSAFCMAFSQENHLTVCVVTHYRPEEGQAEGPYEPLRAVRDGMILAP